MSLLTSIEPIRSDQLSLPSEFFKLVVRFWTAVGLGETGALDAGIDSLLGVNPKVRKYLVIVHVSSTLSVPRNAGMQAPRPSIVNRTICSSDLHCCPECGPPLSRNWS